MNLENIFGCFEILHKSKNIMELYRPRCWDGGARRSAFKAYGSTGGISNVSSSNSEFLCLPESTIWLGSAEDGALLLGAHPSSSHRILLCHKVLIIWVVSGSGMSWSYDFTSCLCLVSFCWICPLSVDGNNWNEYCFCCGRRHSSTSCARPLYIQGGWSVIVETP